MTELKRPFWLEVHQRTDEIWEVSDYLAWQFFESLKIPKEIVTSVNKLCQDFLTNQSPNVLSIKSIDVKGHLYLRKISDGKVYRGIWIPENLPSLISLFGLILKKWDVVDLPFKEWIQEFFRIRLEDQNLPLYQKQNSHQVQLPPPLLVTGGILSDMRLKFETLFQENDGLSTQELLNKVVELLPETYTSVIGLIPSEPEIVLISLLEEYSLEKPVELEFLQSCFNAIETINPVLAKIFLLNRLQIELQSDNTVLGEIVTYAIQKVPEQNHMSYILLLRVLSKYYELQGNYNQATYFYEKLLDTSKENSWYPSYDLIISQLGLARVSAFKGDYFRSLTFYTFARHSLGLFGNPDLEKQAELETLRISILSAMQQLQTGLYLVNHANTSIHALNILLDGLQNGLTLKLTNINNPDISLITVMHPLLNSGANLLEIHAGILNSMFKEPIDFLQLRDIVSNLIKENPNLDTIEQSYNYVNQLNNKNRAMIDKVSVFYNDGRYIGDFGLRDDRIQTMENNPEQNLFSSAMSAVGMLIEEATKSESYVEEIAIGNKVVIFEKGEYVTCALFSKSTSPTLKNKLVQIVKSIETKFAEFLPGWIGDMDAFDGIEEELAPLIPYLIDFEMDIKQVN